MSSEWKSRAATGLAMMVLAGLYGFGVAHGFQRGFKKGQEAGYSAGLEEGGRTVCEAVNRYFGMNVVRIAPPAPRTNRPAWERE